MPPVASPTVLLHVVEAATERIARECALLEPWQAMLLPHTSVLAAAMLRAPYHGQVSVHHGQLLVEVGTLG